MIVENSGHKMIIVNCRLALDFLGQHCILPPEKKEYFLKVFLAVDADSNKV